LAAAFCPKNVAFARKITVLPELGEWGPGAAAPSPLARTPMHLTMNQTNGIWLTI